MKTHSAYRLHAFSLVELSIVLVILGLLTGGILAGQSLIRAAELRAVSTEYSRYVTAMGTFRDKYFALPGDMTNATAFWGTAAACPGVAATAVAGTCNGDGNGLITSSTNSNEPYGAWKHLALGGLIEGAYTGNSGDATATNFTSIIGTNVPRSKLNGAGWFMYGWGNMTIADPNLFEGNYGNALQLAGGPFLKPEEAWNIDTKLDDGLPATGRVRSNENQGNASGTGCSNLAASTTVSLAASVYSLSNTSVACTITIMTGY